MVVSLHFGSVVKNCNHKGLGIYYLLSAFIFGISGTLISVLIRIELYSTGNRIISPENQNFYNISITLHGFIMIFFLVMPGFFGGFGNYFVPIFQGSPEVVYPRVNNFSILILSLSYLFVILSFISEFESRVSVRPYKSMSTPGIKELISCVVKQWSIPGAPLVLGFHGFIICCLWILQITKSQIFFLVLGHYIHH